MRTRLGDLAFERGGLVGLACLALYLALAATHIVDGDNAEFATIGHIGGTAHPSGYPLYTLILRATAWLPGASPAHTAAIATAILGAAAMLCLHAACRAWGARSTAASAAIAIVAAAPFVLRMHTEAEAFALNNLVVALILWLSAPRAPAAGIARAALLGLVAGLGLANHLTCALVAPVGILGVIRGVRESDRKALAMTGAVIGLVLGVLPYLTLLGATETAISWGHIDSFGALVGHVSRSEYGGPGAFQGSGLTVSVLASLGVFAASLGRGWLYVPLVIGLGTLGWLAVKSPDRWGWRMLAVSWLLAGPVLVSRFDISPDHLGRYIMQRFHILPVLLLAIPVAVGFDRLTVRVRGARPGRPWVAHLLATLGLVAMTALALPYLRSIQSPAMEHAAVNLVNAVPENAVVIVDADDLYFGTIYAQAALGVRPDVTIVEWHMLGLPWYRARLEQRGIKLRPGPGAAGVRLATDLLASGRAVFVDALQIDIRNGLPNYPYAGLFRVLAANAPAPTLDALLIENRDAFAKFELDEPQPGPDDEYATMAHSRYGETWWFLSRALERAGRTDDAKAALDLAHRLGPTTE